MATISDFIIRVRTQGQTELNKLKSTIDDTEKSVNKTNDSLNRFTGALGNLGNTLRANAGLNNQFTDTVEGIGGSFGRLGAGIGIVVGAMGLWALKSANTAYELQNLSNATGITAGKLMSLKQSVVEAGGSAADFQTIATKLNMKLGDAARGNQDLRKTFRELGVDLGDANGQLRRTDDLLPEVIQALQRIEDPAKRAAYAVKLFEESGGKLDITKLKAVGDLEFDRQIKELAEYRQKWEEFANFVELKLLKTFLDLKDAIRDVFRAAPQGQTKNPLDVLMAPALIGQQMAIKSNLADQAEQALAGNISSSEMSAEMKKLLRQQGGTATKTGALALTKEQLNAIQLVKDQTRALELRNKIQDQYLDKVQEQIGLEQNLATMETQIAAAYRDNQLAKLALEQQIAAERRKGEETSPAIIASLEKQISLLDKAYNSTVRRAQNEREIRDRIREQSLEQQRQNEYFSMFIDTQIMGLELAARYQNVTGKTTSVEYNNQRELLTFRQQAAAMLVRMEGEIAQATLRGDEIAVASLKKREASLKDFISARELYIKENQKLDTEMFQNAQAGQVAFMEQMMRMTTPFQMIQDANAAVMNNMFSMLDNFVNTGTLRFRDFARSVIADLVKIELKAAAMKLWSALGGFTGIASSIGSLFGFADGGNPPVNRPSIVGERGPELFVPKTAGTIIPNHALAGAGGGPVTNTYITNNINALDARSVAQLFSENRRTLLGATEQARKELPIRQRF